MGGAAFAHESARGGLAIARHANDAAAVAFFQNSGFFQIAPVVMCHARWLNLIWFLPLVLWWRVLKAKRQKEQD
jgi:hypothetical protein